MNIKTLAGITSALGLIVATQAHAGPTGVKSKHASLGFAAPAKGTNALSVAAPLGPPRFQAIAGMPIADELGLVSASLADFGTRVDHAHLRADAVDLVSLAMELKFLEDLTRKKSRVITSAKLLDDASLIVWDENPDFRNREAIRAVLTGYVETGRKKDAAAFGTALHNTGMFGYADDCIGCGGTPPDPFPGPAPDPNPDPGPGSRGGDVTLNFAAARGKPTVTVRIANATRRMGYVYVNGEAMGTIDAEAVKSYIAPLGSTRVRVLDPLGGESSGNALLIAGQTLDLTVKPGPTQFGWACDTCTQVEVETTKPTGENTTVSPSSVDDDSSATKGYAAGKSKTKADSCDEFGCTGDGIRPTWVVFSK